MDTPLQSGAEAGGLCAHSEVNLTELHSNFKISLVYTATSCLQRKWRGRGQNITAALLMRAANRMNQVFIISEILEENFPKENNWQWQGTVSRYNTNEFQSEG